MSDVWDLVHGERQALIDDLAGLSHEQWRTPSLCEGWSVHDVAAHLVDNAYATPIGVVVAMIRARGDFDRQNQQGMERARGATPADTLDRLRAVAGRRTSPPAPRDSRLVEEVVHGEDVRRPLRLHRDYPTETVARAVRYQARTPDAFGGSKGVAAALTLRGTDDDLVLGDGPEVVGPAVSLLLAVCGRRVALDDLTGPGASGLREGWT